MPAVFFSPPKPPSAGGFSVDATPDVNTARFEGGYSQRSKRGPNHIRRRTQLLFENLTEAENNSLLVFMAARGGTEPFRYAPPGLSVEANWIAPTWGYRPSRTKVGWDFRVSIEEVFDIIQ